MKIAKSWYEVLQEELSKPYIQKLKKFLEEERGKGIPVYPPEEKIFEAFKYTPFDLVKVVIIGQDPYHGIGQAHGLSFSVLPGVNPPPSLKNIFKELENDVAIPPPKSGCLIEWARQGVLLLNATLTVRAKEPKSHHGKGWEEFTDAVIEKLAMREKPVVFLLWGSLAKEKCKALVGHPRHVVLQAPHPSPYSVHSGFFGCHHFSKANGLLSSWGVEPIDWSVRD